MDITMNSILMHSRMPLRLQSYWTVFKTQSPLKLGVEEKKYHSSQGLNGTFPLRRIHLSVQAFVVPL